MMLYLMLVLIFIRPFISSLAYPGANSVYSLSLIILLAFWLIKDSSWRQEFKKIALPVICFSLTLAISTYFSINRIKSVAELYKYLSAILLILALSNLTEKSRKMFLETILGCGLIISILALYQYFVGFAHLRNFINTQNITSPFVLDYLRQKRVFFPFVTPGILAGYLTMITPLVLLYKKRVWIFLPLLYALFLTASLGAFIGLFLTALTYLLLRKDFKKMKILALAGLVLLIILVFLIRAASGQGHLSPAFSIAMRLNYWQDALEIIKARPFLGIGLGNFNLIYSRYAHNSFLQFWAEAGLIGIASLFWLVFSLLKNKINKTQDFPGNREKIILLSCLAAFIFHNLWDFGFFLPEVCLIWWSILGLLPKSKS